MTTINLAQDHPDVLAAIQAIVAEQKTKPPQDQDWRDAYLAM